MSRLALHRLLRFLSRIWIRLLAFNVLLIFLPALGLLTFRAYEQRLLRMQEDSMVQQGRIFAAALAAHESLELANAQSILVNMRQEFQARLRVIDQQGNLLADSSRLGPRIEVEGQTYDGQVADATRHNALYRLGSFLYGLLFDPPESPPDAEFYARGAKFTGPEIQKALEGSYGATYRRFPGQTSLTLYSALPVRNGDRVIGVVLVSKSTVQILSDLYELRLAAFKVVMASVLAAIVLSLLVATTIARPVSRLRLQALALLDRRGRLRGRFRGSRSLDEIGDLSRALAELTRRLESHLKFVESFASDVSHEFKNPLAAIRSATELLEEVEDPVQRQRFLTLAQGEVARLERLLTDVREVTQIDLELDEAAAPLDLRQLLGGLVERFEMLGEQRLRFHLEMPSRAVWVAASADRLTQVFENLLANAADFSADDSEIRIELSRDKEAAQVNILDRGPGVPTEHLEKIFDRFFTYRAAPRPTPSCHSGLGLAIVKAIVEGYGGMVSVSNRKSGGARFEVRLPNRPTDKR